MWSRNFFESRSFQAAESKQLETARREAESAPSETDASNAAHTGPRASGRSKLAKRAEVVLGRIEIPRLGITAMVAEGTDGKTLARAVGHIRSTALPGRPGNCALAGHRDTHFRGLGGVRVNDVIRVVTKERTYTYEVEWSVVVKPQRVDLVDSTAAPSLTLITCYPFAYVGRAPKRFVVRARQVESVTVDRGPIESPGPPAAPSANRRPRQAKRNRGLSVERFAPGRPARPSAQAIDLIQATAGSAQVSGAGRNYNRHGREAADPRRPS